MVALPACQPCDYCPDLHPGPAQVGAAGGFLTPSTFQAVFPSVMLHFKGTKAAGGTEEAWLKLLLEHEPLEPKVRAWLRDWV